MSGNLEIGASYDVIVIGSGAGGMTAALRARDNGHSVLMVEKAHHFGGTSATAAGGIWVPLNPDALAAGDTVEKSLSYLKAAILAAGTTEPIQEDRLLTYINNAAPMTRYVGDLGVTFFPVKDYPDYYSELPGAMKSRGLGPDDIDGADLGDDFFRLRDHHPVMLAFNRYAMNYDVAKALSERQPGWQLTALGMVLRYWLDIPWRLKTRRDRRLTWGRGLVGMLRRAMIRKDIPISLNTELVELEKKGRRITGVILDIKGRRFRVGANAGVIIAAGGFEQNQQMRDIHMPVPTQTEASLPPKEGNKGSAIEICQQVGAGVENMGSAWWTPTMRMPSRAEANIDVVYPLFFERALPGSICVNRLGRRFVNEAITYERFGSAMIADQLATGANNPCWMVFDASYRQANAAGGLMPGNIAPDRSLPDDWWDNIVYRAETIEGLAEKIGVDPAALSQTVKSMNQYAQTGVDEEFQRGSFDYDRFWGVKKGNLPNNCLGPLERAPFYAIPVYLGDLGTNGGLSIDANGAVVDKAGKPIPGLYATGNTIGSIFGKAYPGGGVTLGQAMIFGYVTANAIAASQKKSSDQAAA